MLNIPVRVFRITVVFNPLNPDPTQKIALLSDDIQVDTIVNQHTLRIPQGIALIVLDLMTLPGGEEAFPAEFFEEPLTWLNPNIAELPPPPPVPPLLPSPWSVTQPEVFLVQRFIPNHLTIVDINTVKQENSHPVNVNVTYGGELYSSDPIIVNEPPMPVG
ncbi:MAG TPA: hypothetical protein VLX28_16375 [Thermoanaerobaculia bacterium]|nr:hypothetical protein [Thermoanaerobaculia bacterium]